MDATRPYTRNYHRKGQNNPIGSDLAGVRSDPTKNELFPNMRPIPVPGMGAKTSTIKKASQGQRP